MDRKKRFNWNGSPVNEKYAHLHMEKVDKDGMTTLMTPICIHRYRDNKACTTRCRAKEEVVYCGGQCCCTCMLYEPPIEYRTNSQLLIEF